MRFDDFSWQKTIDETEHIARLQSLAPSCAAQQFSLGGRN